MLEELKCDPSKPVSFKRLPRKQPLDIFLRFCDDYDYAFLFESIGDDENRARFSFMGFEPRIVVTIKDGVAYVSGEKLKVDDPLDVIKALVGRGQHHNRHRYIGGAVGYISYDSIRYWEKLPNISADDLGFPDVEMGIYDDGIIFDHLNNKVSILFLQG